MIYLVDHILAPRPWLAAVFVTAGIISVLFLETPH